MKKRKHKTFVTSIVWQLQNGAKNMKSTTKMNCLLCLREGLEMTLLPIVHPVHVVYKLRRKRRKNVQDVIIVIAWLKQDISVLQKVLLPDVIQDG
jgi:hypothetical protein